LQGREAAEEGGGGRQRRDQRVVHRQLARVEPGGALCVQPAKARVVAEEGVADPG
jgi:hypothetical protein